MARYIVLRLESNETAQELLERFKPVPAIEVVGVFGSASKFCPGKSVCGEDRKIIRSRKWGTIHCSVCKLAVSSLPQEPRNLLHEDLDLHPRFVDLRLSVWEPLENPVEKYGQDSIDRTNDQAAAGKERIRRHKRRKARNGG